MKDFTNMQTVKPEPKQRQMPFHMHISTIFGEVISRHRVRPDPQKLKAFTEMQHPKTKKELQTFLGIINYLG